MIAAVLLGSALALVLLLECWSWPGEPRPILDAGGRVVPGSISEKIYVEIGGVRQGMIIQSRDPKNPVLLYLHGGLPDYFLTERYPTGLEDHFTMVWWEQRGSGISYRPDLPPESLTLDRLVEDTLEVTRYLERRFGQDKIYLMGHSGGTFIGLHAAARAPELYRAYIGVAQMANQPRSEKRAYDFMLAEAKRLGDDGLVRRLEAAPVTADRVPEGYHRVRDEAMHALGVGTTRDLRSIVTGIVLASWQSRQYTLGEKFATWRGKATSGIGTLWTTMVTTDLTDTVPEVAVPVYFLHGRFDYTCTYAEAQTYFKTLRAPVKGFYTFERSAHSPLFEEPARTRQILLEDVLHGTNHLADAGE